MTLTIFDTFLPGVLDRCPLQGKFFLPLVDVSAEYAQVHVYSPLLALCLMVSCFSSFFLSLPGIQAGIRHRAQSECAESTSLWCAPCAVSGDQQGVRCPSFPQWSLTGLLCLLGLGGPKAQTTLQAHPLWAGASAVMLGSQPIRCPPSTWQLQSVWLLESGPAHPVCVCPLTSPQLAVDRQSSQPAWPLLWLLPCP